MADIDPKSLGIGTVAAAALWGAVKVLGGALWSRAEEERRAAAADREKATRERAEMMELLHSISERLARVEAACDERHCHRASGPVQLAAEG